MSETSSIVSPLLKLLQAWPGVSAQRNHQGGSSRRGQWIRTASKDKGRPDITGVIAPHGRAFSIECKMPKTGRISDDQKKWRDNFEQLGGFYAIITTVSQGVGWIRYWQDKEQQRKQSA